MNLAVHMQSDLEGVGFLLQITGVRMICLCTFDKSLISFRINYVSLSRYL